MDIDESLHGWYMHISKYYTCKCIEQAVTLIGISVIVRDFMPNINLT